jgi:hypothetical protein
VNEKEKTMKKALLATVMAFLVSSVSYADELRLEATAGSAKLGGFTLSAEEQVRHDLSISEDMVTKAAGYEHTVFAVSRDLTENMDLQLRIRNTNTNGTSENRVSLDVNNGVALPLGIKLDNRLRLQLDEHGDVTQVGAEQLRLREQIVLTKSLDLKVATVDVSVGDEIHVNQDGVSENRILAAASTAVGAGVSVRAEYFRQQNTEGDDANVVTLSAGINF